MRPSFDPRPVALEGETVRLEPLADSHAEGLLAAATSDPGIWRYLPCAPVRSLEDARGFVAGALAEAAGGGQVPFAIVIRATGEVAGSTRYLEIRHGDRALEIGWTWIGAPHQRTRLNTECKFLLLRHAFEDLGAHRVQFKTDARNERSQRALQRIGAVREGVLRRHRVNWDGHVRDSVYFSILDAEWPAVRARLEGLLATAPPMRVRIAELTIADHAEAVALWESCEGIGLSGADGREEIALFLDRNPGLSFGAREDGRLVGAVLGGHDGRRGFLHHLAVAQSHRRRGLGRNLVGRCLAALGAAGIAKCHVFVRGENAGARAFWKRLGWTLREDLVTFSMPLDTAPPGGNR